MIDHIVLSSNTSPRRSQNGNGVESAAVNEALVAHYSIAPQLLSVRSQQAVIMFPIERCGWNICIERQNVHWYSWNPAPSSSVLAKSVCRLFQEANCHTTDQDMDAGAHLQRTTSSRHPQRNRQELLTALAPREGLRVHHHFLHRENTVERGPGGCPCWWEYPKRQTIAHLRRRSKI